MIIVIGILHSRYEKQTKKLRQLEGLLADSNKELVSLEILKSRFLIRIGDVLSVPLKAIEASSRRLTSADSGVSENLLKDLQDLYEEVRSLIRIMSVFEEITTNNKTLEEPDFDADAQVVQMDEIVSEVAMGISDDATDKLVSLSVAICGTVEVFGRRTQLFEIVSSILREALKRAESGSVLIVNLTTEQNMELETIWHSDKKPATEEQDLLGAGFIRLVASSHGGWLTVDKEHGFMKLTLPLAGENE